MRPIVILVLCLAFFSSRVQSSNLMQVLKSQSPVLHAEREHTAYIKWPYGKWRQESNWFLGGRPGYVEKLTIVRAKDKNNKSVLTGKVLYHSEIRERDFYAEQFRPPTGIDYRFWTARTMFDTPNFEEQALMPEDGVWIIGGRTNQYVNNVNLFSKDGGLSLEGTITYAGEGPLEFRTAL